MVNFILGMHNHQPEGNFDWVFRSACRDCYLPFLRILRKHKKIKVCLHYTGPLLEWMEKNSPEAFSLIRELIKSGQTEIMGGGFYEPILPVIPERDALGQIKMMQEYINDRFGVKPKGMWLAERVWEPSLPSLIEKSGLRFTVVDDTHFYCAGFKERDVRGYYITEDEGRLIAVFPIDKELRYRIPFRMPEETLEYMRRLPAGCCVTLADDGEKFGMWPGTHKWVYEDGYLDRLFGLLEQNSSWIRMATFSEYMESQPPSGKIYLPAVSYDEMMEWSLPSEAQREFAAVTEGLKEKGDYNRVRPYLRGGFWRNFLAKYPEANLMYGRMMYVSRQVDGYDLSKAVKKKALKELYKAQCNCGYWHGLFGGLYLNYLRHAVYTHLIRAEKLIDLKPCTADDDFDLDGRNEILLSSKNFNIYIKPEYGGHIFELDYRPKDFNLSNVLSRRPEVYHTKIEKRVEKNCARPCSIHDISGVKEEGLGSILFYDRYRRDSLIDHILHPSSSLDDFAACRYRELGDFSDGEYGVLGRSRAGITLVKQGSVNTGSEVIPFTIKKTVEIENKGIKIDYELENGGSVPIEICFGIEFNLTLLAGNDKSRYYRLNGRDAQYMPLSTKDECKGVDSVSLVDEVYGFTVNIAWDAPAVLWRFPVNTVSRSEAGIERTYQGSCIVPRWKMKMEPYKKRKGGVMRKIGILLACVLFVFTAGCTGTEKGAGIGAVSGGVIGGVVGHQGGRTAEGVAIGTVAGAVLGGIIGNEASKSAPPSPARVIATCPNGHQVDVTGFAPGTNVRCPICNSIFKIK